MKHYVLMPGYVHSQFDDDRHYITWQDLQKLYRLERRQFSVHRGFRKDDSPILDPAPPKDAELVHLRPSYTGDYSLPE